MRKVKRSEFATFLNTTPASTETWSRMGKGITGQTLAYNPTVNTNQFIDEDSGTSELEAYAPNIPTPQNAIVGDAVFDYVDSLRKTRALGSDAETDLLMVYIYDKDADDAYTAEKQRVVISIDDFGGDGGNPVVINYTVNFVGDAEMGTCTIVDGKPTFTKK